MLRRTLREFGDDHCTDLAAALDLLRRPGALPRRHRADLPARRGRPGPVQRRQRHRRSSSRWCRRARSTPSRPALESIATSQGAGLGLVLGVAGALWSASGYVGAFGRAMNSVYEIDEGRPFWKLRPVMLLVTLVAIVLVAVVLVMLVVSGPLASSIGSVIGPQQPGGDRLEHREVAGDRAVRRADRRDPLLRHPQREAAEVPLAVRRRGRRDRGVDPRVRGVRVLRRHVRQLQQDLRLAGRRGGLPAVAVDHQPGAPVRRRSSTPSSSGAGSSRPASRPRRRSSSPRATPEASEGPEEGAKDLARAGPSASKRTTAATTHDTKEKTP